jgi:hypothetical protein
MSLTKNTKEKINQLIYERAYEIEQILSEDNFYRAELCGIAPEEVSNVSLQTAIKIIKKELHNA